ncbi:MAG: hypothetical protein LH606_05155 [Cytophagaceae bacterium]|nr:hypothetical protein [Cytophagaceae bacterium]
MTTDYRILAHALPIEDDRGTIVFSLHKVHITHNGELLSYNAVPWHGASHSPQEVKQWARILAQASEKPILWADDRANKKRFPALFETSF